MRGARQKIIVKNLSLKPNSKHNLRLFFVLIFLSRFLAVFGPQRKNWPVFASVLGRNLFNSVKIIKYITI